MVIVVVVGLELRPRPGHGPRAVGLEQELVLPALDAEPTALAPVLAPRVADDPEPEVERVCVRVGIFLWILPSRKTSFTRERNREGVGRSFPEPNFLDCMVYLTCHLIEKPYVGYQCCFFSSRGRAVVSSAGSPHTGAIVDRYRRSSALHTRQADTTER